MGEIAQRFDNVTFSPNIFTPYPGIPIWPELKERGCRARNARRMGGYRSWREQSPVAAGATVTTSCNADLVFLLDNELN